MNKNSKESEKRRSVLFKARRRAIIDKAKSGGCELCGYSKCLSALEFHHTCENKVAEISDIKSNAKMAAEIDKCICVCANCHREIHAGLVPGYEYIKEAPVVELTPLLELMEG